MIARIIKIIIGIFILSFYIQEKEKTTQPEKVSASTSVADELKNYKELLDSGIITQEEFDKKKKELLGF